MLRVARFAYQLTQEVLPPFSHPKSPHRFTQPQLAACVLMMFYLNLSYRDMEEWLLASEAVCETLDVTHIPDHSTLQRTFKKLRRTTLDQLKNRLLDQLSVDEEAIATDCTGFTPSQASAYFQARSGRTIREYVKGAYAVGTESQLIVGWRAGSVHTSDIAMLPSLRQQAQRYGHREIGWDVEARGLFNAPPVRVLVGDVVHVTVLKALGMLGLGRENVERLPVDGQGRVQAGSLPKIHSPSIVCLQAGNVNTGAIDPIDEICSRLAPGQAWVHVDGAFGLWASASPALSDQLKGVEMADSWATDAHKWLNVPYDSGLAFIRQLEHLKASMSTSAAYLVTSAQRDPHEFTPEFSRRARGVEIWAALRSLGRQGLAEMVERCCSCARQFAQGLTNAGFSVLNEVNLNQVLVSFGSPQVTRQSLFLVVKTRQWHYRIVPGKQCALSWTLLIELFL